MMPRFATTIPAVPVGGLLLLGLLTFIARNPPPGGLGDPQPRAQDAATGNERVQNDRPPREPATAAAAMLVGTWNCSAPLGGGETYVGRVTYAADGSFEASYKAASPFFVAPGEVLIDIPRPVQLWGHWTVDGEELIRTITRTSPASEDFSPDRTVLTIARADFLKVGDESCHPAAR